MWRSGRMLAVPVGQSRSEPMVPPMAVVREEGVVPMNGEIRRIQPTDAKIRRHRRWWSPSGPVSTDVDGAGMAGVFAASMFHQSGYAVAHPGCRAVGYHVDQSGYRRRRCRATARVVARGLDGQR